MSRLLVQNSSKVSREDWEMRGKHPTKSFLNLLHVYAAIHYVLC